MIKLFHHRRHDELEALVQAWLKQNPQIRVTGMASASSNFGHSLTLLMEEATQPHRYRFAAFFRHGGLSGISVDEVEAEAKAWMDGRGRPCYVAQSANDSGLFLALLVEVG